MTTKAIIIDDEKGARESLSNILRDYCPEVEVVAKAENIEVGYDTIEKHKPELVFLDIEMPHGNAFDLLEKFEEIDFDIIFVTAYDHYAINAIKFSALDYLLKPIDIDELQAAVSRHVNNSGKYLKQKYELLLQNIKKDKAPEKVAIADNESISFIEIATIVRCESDGNYTTLFLETGKKIVVSKTLGEFENMFSQNNFFRTHRSHLINLAHMAKYVKGEGGYVEMSDGSKAEVSRRKKPEFLANIG